MMCFQLLVDVLPSLQEEAVCQTKSYFSKVSCADRCVGLGPCVITPGLASHEIVVWLSHFIRTYFFFRMRRSGSAVNTIDMTMTAAEFQPMN